jgi:hypothetical protein
MKNAPQLITKDESFLAPQCPIADGIQHALQCTVWLDEHGYIQDSDGSVEHMFGYWFEELKEQHISLLLPALAHAQLLTQDRINPILHFRCHCSIPFRGVSANGHEDKYIVFMNLLSYQLGPRLSMTIRDHVA